MGGTISMIIRKPTGEVLPMLRWTNIIPNQFTSIPFHRGDFDAWWPEFVKEWDGMKADYEMHKGTGVFQYPMTSTYFPDVGCAPCGYGILVADWVKMKLTHHQGYSWPGPYLRGDILQEELQDDPSYAKTLLACEDLFEGGQNKELESFIIKVKALIEKGEDFYTPGTVRFPIRSKWKIINGQAEHKNGMEILPMLQADGFVFTDEELKTWKEHFQEDVEG